MTQSGWQHFEHEADIGVRGIGNSIAEAFEQAACATNAIVTDLSLIKIKDTIELYCQESDPELLLVDWLNALIYEMATRKMLFCKFKVNIKGDKLSAQVWGDHINVKQHQPAVEIKGATYTELAVYKTDNLWIAQCVVDV